MHSAAAYLQHCHLHNDGGEMTAKAASKRSGAQRIRREASHVSAPSFSMLTAQTLANIPSMHGTPPRSSLRWHAKPKQCTETVHAHSNAFSGVEGASGFATSIRTWPTGVRGRQTTGAWTVLGWALAKCRVHSQPKPGPAIRDGKLAGSWRFRNITVVSLTRNR